jgi:7-cyano-7-deazaguanine reductase
MKNNIWSRNRHVLKKIKNPSKRKYEIEIVIPELTFEGDKKKPDFGKLCINFCPNDCVIELKSLKEYIYEFRNQLYSYERIINVIFDDIMEIYNPKSLSIILSTNPRGGISSKLKVDSENNV